MSAVLSAREPSAKYLVASRPSLIRDFELFATAPAAFTKLRELILVLAVRGNIVKQRSEDEPASSLIAKIEKEKIRLISEKRLRNRSELPSISEAEHSFSLPVGWVWSRLGNLGDWGAGATPSRSRGDYYGGDIPWFKSGELTGDSIGQSEETVTQLALKECSLRLNQVGDVLVAMYGATIGKTAILAKVGTTNQAVCACTPFSGLDKRYLLLLLKALRPYFVSIGAGGAQPNISREKLIATVVGLPPLAEQHRIVTRVEELMKLCDALEARGRLADEQHARLTSTLFDALAASESAHALAENWQRIAEHFDLLLDRPDAIGALEQTILQLAARGLLVPQNAKDESATALLKRVAAKQAALESEVKSQAREEGEEPDAPYPLPEDWAWASLGELTENMGSGWSPACDEGERTDPNRWAVLRTTAVQLMEYRSHEHKALPAKLQGRPGIEVKQGDILITRAGPMNRVGVSCWVDQTPHRLMLSDKIVRFHIIDDEMLPAFVVMSLNAGWTKDQLEASKSGMAASQVNITQSDLRNILIPVCSRAEQNRIVVRVEELRHLCAQLRERLTSARRTQSQLAEALVAEAA